MYGQQMQNPIASAAKWLFLGFLGIILMAILLGVNIKDATWFNPEIASAEAKRLNIETAHQQATYELQEQLAKAQTVAEIQAIQREQKLLDAQYEHEVQILAQDINHREMAFKTVMGLLTFIGAAISIAIIIGTILWFSSKAWANARVTSVKNKTANTLIPPAGKIIYPTPKREPYNPWASSKYRRQKIKAARQEEINQRQKNTIASMKALKDPARMSKEDYNKKPLAGD